MNYKKRAAEQKRYKDLYPSILYDGKIMFLGRLLQQATMRDPGHVALVFEGKEVTYRDLYQRAVSISHQLLNMESSRATASYCL